MKKAEKLHLSEFETNNPNLFECLLFVKKFVDNNSTVTDAYVENGNYVVHFKDAHPYLDGLVKPNTFSYDLLWGVYALRTSRGRQKPHKSSFEKL